MLASKCVNLICKRKLSSVVFKQKQLRFGVSAWSYLPSISILYRTPQHSEFLHHICISCNQLSSIQCLQKKQRFLPSNYSSESSRCLRQSSVLLNKNKIPEQSGSEELSKAAKLRRVVTQYGAFGAAVHITISLGFLSITYLLISSGVDLVGLLGSAGIEVSNLVGGASTFVVAYAVHKLIFPLRATVSMVIIPLLVRYLRKIGFFKP